MQNSSVLCGERRLLQFGLELGGLGVLRSGAGPVPGTVRHGLQQGQDGGGSTLTSEFMMVQTW